MDQQHAVGWLHRRAGFGLHPTELAEASERGAPAELAAMASTPPERADPWADFELDPRDGGRVEVVRGWIETMHTTDRPFHDRRTLMLHGWLVSSIDKVIVPEMMVDQIRLFMDTGGGSFADLLRAITVDRAMLVYLDGRTSTAGAPNENYGRELLELFGLGVGQYTEADVQAAARALTGWVVDPRLDTARFVARRHDDTTQQLLSAQGVNDVDSVIDAVVDDDLHATYVATRIMRDYLGDTSGDIRSAVVDELRRAYLDADLRLDSVIVRALELGLDDLRDSTGELTTGRMVLAPIPWTVICMRATGVSLRRLGRDVAGTLRDMGQIPTLPPSVAGWPTGTAWLTSSSMVARARMASAIASATAPDEPVSVALADDDLDLVARHLGLGSSFGSATIDAIGSTTDPAARLALALVSPENLLS